LLLALYFGIEKLFKNTLFSIFYELLDFLYKYTKHVNIKNCLKK